MCCFAPRAMRGSLTDVMLGWSGAVRARSFGKLARLHLGSAMRGNEKARANSGLVVDINRRFNVAGLAPARDESTFRHNRRSKVAGLALGGIQSTCGPG